MSSTGRSLSGLPTRELQNIISLSRLLIASKMAVEFKTQEEVVFISRIWPMADLFARPVLHVTDVDASIRFYVDRLGFSSPWRFEEDGKTFVAQVERQGCALILSSHWPEKVGKGLMFISLNVEPETHEAAVAALDALRAELEAKGAPVKDGRWGYRLLVVEDPDGNQLYFNYPNELADGDARASISAESEAHLARKPEAARPES